MDSDDEMIQREEPDDTAELLGYDPLPMASQQASTRSMTQRRASQLDHDQDHSGSRPTPQRLSLENRGTGSGASIRQPRPRPLPTPHTSAADLPVAHLLHSAPASPPTPAPSPPPNAANASWDLAGEDEDAYLRDARGVFSQLNIGERERFLAEVLNMCDSHTLSFVQQFVSPRLRKDPFTFLPNEVCLRVRTSTPAYIPGLC